MKKADPRRVLSPDHVNGAPACFNDDFEYHRYEYLRKISQVKSFDRNFCVDCTPEYQEEMLKQGRCEHPEARFIRVWDKVGEAKEPQIYGISCRSRHWDKLVSGEEIELDGY